MKISYCGVSILHNRFPFFKKKIPSERETGEFLIYFSFNFKNFDKTCVLIFAFCLNQTMNQACLPQVQSKTNVKGIRNFHAIKFYNFIIYINSLTWKMGPFVSSFKKLTRSKKPATYLARICESRTYYI